MFLSSFLQSDYINWKHGEPDGGNLSQDCVAMLPQSDNKWADVNCLNSWSYVCKKTNSRNSLTFSTLPGKYVYG